MNSRWGNVAAALCAIAASACGGGAGSGEGAKAADAPNAAVKIPLEVWDFTLQNGMRVILDEDKSAPIVAVNVWYKVGSKDDPPGRGGFAHLFEHLMFQGTHTFDGDVWHVLADAGATDINATTAHDRTEYHETVPRGALEWALWFEAERMATMGERLDQANFDRERSVVKNELRQRYENIEAGWFWSIRARALFGKDHPYGHPGIGSIAELDAATLEEVRAFHKRFYQPSNAVLALVGDFDHKQAAAWLGKYFAPIPNVPASPERRKLPPQVSGERRVLVEAKVPYPYLMVTYPAPPEGSPDLAALRAIGAHIAGWLDYWLIEERKYAREVDWIIEPGMLASMADFTIKLRKDADPEEALRVLDRAIFDEPPRRFGSINAPLNHIKVQELFYYEPFAKRAAMYAHFDDLTGNPLFIARELEAVQRTGRAEAFDARAKFLQNKNRVVTIVRPSPSAPLGGRVVQGG